MCLLHKNRFLPASYTWDGFRHSYVVEFIVESVPTISIVDSERYVTSDAVRPGFYPMTTPGFQPGHAAMLTNSPQLGMQALCHV